MPIVLCEASKATPYKGLAYIMNEEKTLAAGNQGFVTLGNDPSVLAQQMMMTMRVHGKGKKVEERKYYHAKVSFDPCDLPENGGTLTPEKANHFAAEYAAKTWPGREVAWSVQHHGTAMHIHFIVAAVEQETGKKLDARDAEYRGWKDGANDLALKYGLSAIDWRQATADKRAAEIQPDLPVKETFAEKGLKSRGESSWKDELRDIIDEAAARCVDMDEFVAALEKQGVTLTRCTEQTISYKLGDHKACRGDTLGGDYTAAAIRDALQHNREDPTQKKRPSIDEQIEAKGTMRELGKEGRECLREFGRVVGFKRSEVDQMIDNASKATWAEKQEAWSEYRMAKDEFWDEYTIRQQALKEEISELYRRRRLLRSAEWELDPRNHRFSIVGTIFAIIVLFTTDDDIDMLDEYIEELKREQAALRKQVKAFKQQSAGALDTLRKKDLSTEQYMRAVRNMQRAADHLAEKNFGLSEYERDNLREQAAEDRERYLRKQKKEKAQERTQGR